MELCTKDEALWGTPGEGSPPKNSPLDSFSPFLRHKSQRILQSADCKAGLRPTTPPPFEKGGRKLLNFLLSKFDYTIFSSPSAEYFSPALFFSSSRPRRANFSLVMGYITAPRTEITRNAAGISVTLFSMPLTVFAF